MAWASVGTLGSNQDKTSSTSIVLTTTAVAEVGKVILVAIGADNIGTTDGDLSEISSVVDSAGNTYTKRKEQTNGQGAAEGGVTVSLWQTKVTTELASGGTITANFAAAVTAKAISAWAFTVTAGATITLEGSDADVHDGAQPAAMSISGLASQEYLWFVADCEENVNTGTYTPDADYTAIDKNGTTGGGGTTNVYIAGAFRIFTGTGDTYTATTNANRDGAQVYIALKEAAGGGGDTQLTVAEAGQAQAVDAPALTQAHVATVADAAQGQAADTVALVQQYVATVADAAQAQTVDSPALTQQHVVTPADASQAQVVDSPALTQQYVLAVQAVAQAQAADNVTVDTGTVLTVADAGQTQTVDSPALLQQHVAGVADAAQGQAVDSPALAQAYVLSVADVAQAQRADNVTLGEPPAPAPAAETDDDAAFLFTAARRRAREESPNPWDTLLAQLAQANERQLARRQAELVELSDARDLADLAVIARTRRRG